MGRVVSCPEPQPVRVKDSKPLHTERSVSPLFILAIRTAGMSPPAKSINSKQNSNFYTIYRRRQDDAESRKQLLLDA